MGNIILFIFGLIIVVTFAISSYMIVTLNWLLPKDKKRSWFSKSDDYFERFTSKWKQYYKLDFFDSGVLFIFISGLIILLYLFLRRYIIIDTLVSGVILFITFISILIYTKETLWLKRVEQKSYKMEIRKYKSELNRHIAQAKTKYVEVGTNRNKEIREIIRTTQQNSTISRQQTTNAQNDSAKLRKSIQEYWKSMEKLRDKF